MIFGSPSFNTKVQIHEGVRRSSASLARPGHTWGFYCEITMKIQPREVGFS